MGYGDEGEMGYTIWLPQGDMQPRCIEMKQVW